MIETPVKLLGSPGSPYTRKMLALLRYRRIPYALIIGSHRDATDLPRPKVALLPTFYLSDGEGNLEAVVDSTPLIRRLDAEFPERKVIPVDSAVAFLDDLLEDFADEWLTKAMFHYRWRFTADAAQAGDILPRWSVEPRPEAALAPVQSSIRGRQIARLYVVGSNDVTAPVIEASYGRVLAALAAHLESSAFLLGDRPGASDFAFYGQLTQLTHFDPTPMAIALKEAPRVFAWVDVVEDLSGLEPAPADSRRVSDLGPNLRRLLDEIGRVYVPVLLANARTVASGAARVETEVDGLPWVQDPFPYQVRCLACIRDAFTVLPADARKQVLGLLEGTGCEAMLAPSA